MGGYWAQPLRSQVQYSMTKPTRRRIDHKITNTAAAKAFRLLRVARLSGGAQHITLARLIIMLVLHGHLIAEVRIAPGLKEGLQQRSGRPGGRPPAARKRLRERKSSPSRWGAAKRFSSAAPIAIGPWPRWARSSAGAESAARRLPLGSCQRGLGNEFDTSVHSLFKAANVKLSRPVERSGSGSA